MIMKLRSIVIDDSTLQRIAVTKLVNNHPNLTMVGEYSNAIEAKNGIKNTDFDLIFLDIEMPIISGFDLLETLENPQQVILISGKADYALKAFDYGVTDYLLKPISMARFNTAIKRCLSKYEELNKLKEQEEYIFVKSNLKKRKIILNDIQWIEALGDYVKLVTEETNIIVLSTMKSFENQLPKDKFIRIHKSYIVNLGRIEKFNSSNVEVCGRKMPLSRSKKAVLEEALTSL